MNIFTVQTISNKAYPAMLELAILQNFRQKDDEANKRMAIKLAKGEA